MYRLLLVAVLSGCGLMGCSHWTPPSPHQPMETTPEQAWSAQYQAGAFISKDLPDSLSDELDSLLQEAFASNPSLKQQQLLVEQQLQLLRITDADRWPSVEAYLEGGNQTLESLGVEFSWEFDWLGRLSSRYRATLLDAQVELESWLQQRTELASTVAQQWFDLIEAQQQAELVEERIKNLAANLSIIEDGYLNGLNQPLDVFLARTDLASAKATGVTRQDERLVASRALEITLGRYPSASLLANEDFNTQLTAIPAGLPSELLTRRHDLRAAKARLAAADWRALAAYRDRFPRLALTGSYDRSSTELSELLKSGSSTWTLFTSLSAPLFDAGALKAQQASQQSAAAQQNQAYQQAVLTAFQSVEDALAKEGRYRQSLTLLEAASKDAEAAKELAFEQYLAGLSEYTTVLESERRAFDAQSSAISARNLLLKNRVTLYQALGGSFGDEPQSPSPLKQTSQLIDDGSRK